MHSMTTNQNLALPAESEEYISSILFSCVYFMNTKFKMTDVKKKYSFAKTDTGDGFH